MPKTKLRELFPLEASSHKTMLARVKEGRATLAPEFRTFVDFLCSVLPEIGRRPKDKTLDRIDNAARHYGPGGVRWATATEQNRNRSNTIRKDGKSNGQPVCEIAIRRGLNPATVRRRVNRGWEQADALNIATGGRRPRRKEGKPILQPVAREAVAKSLLFRVWHDAHIMSGLHAPLPWTGAQSGQARTMAKRLEAAGVSAAEFLQFAINNFQQVVASRLSWRQDVPEFPTIRFICGDGRLDAFFAAFHTSDLRKPNSKDAAS